MALLNSRLLNYYYTQKFTNQSLLTVNISKTFLEQLPIPILNLDHSIDRATHDRIVQQVKTLEALYIQLSNLQRSELQTTDRSLKHDYLKQEITMLDRQLDHWICELYRLTNTEIEFIESQTNQTQKSQTKKK